MIAGVDVNGCIACDLSSGRRPLPGGLIYATEHWSVEHCVGPLGVGTLIVKPARHVEHVADLDAREAAELGPLLQKATAVVTELCASEQVYICLWSHAGAVPGHIHFVVQPVGDRELQRFGAHGPALQVAMFEAADAPDTEAVERLADAARRSFGAA